MNKDRIICGTSTGDLFVVDLNEFKTITKY